VALGNAQGRGTITVTARQVTELKQTITVSNEGGSTASGTLDGMIQANADVVPGDSGSPLLGMSTCSVCTLRLRARSPVASGSARARLAPSLPCRRPSRPQSSSAVLPMPLPPQHQHPAQLVTGRRQHALQRERSRTGRPAYGVHVNSAVSFSVPPTIAHVSVRVALAASQLRLPASRNSANQPGRHALSARAAMTPCPAGAQVRRRAIPPRRDCSHRSVADPRNSTGRTSSPQRCMSAGPGGTPVSFGA
jgi:hypothetical protein